MVKLGWLPARLESNCKAAIWRVLIASLGLIRSLPKGSVSEPLGPFMQTIVPDPEDLGIGIKVSTPPRLKQTNLSDFREEGNSDNAAAILTFIEVWNITPVDQCRSGGNGQQDGPCRLGDAEPG